MARGTEQYKVKKTLISIENQSVPVFEVVIIAADLETKENYEKLERDGEWSLKTKVIVQKGKTLGSALMQGVLTCEGDYISRIDVDDVMHQERIEKQVKQLELHNADVVCSQALKIINNGIEVKKYTSKFNKSKRIGISDLIFINPIMHPTVMMRKSMAIEHNYQDDKYMEDYVLWINLVKKNKVILFFNDCLTTINIDPLQFKRRSEFQLLSEELKICNMKKGDGVKNFYLITSFLIRISYVLAPLWAKNILFRITNLEMKD